MSPPSRTRKHLAYASLLYWYSVGSQQGVELRITSPSALSASVAKSALTWILDDLYDPDMLSNDFYASQQLQKTLCTPSLLCCGDYYSLP